MTHKSLAGTWKFELDREDQGIAEEWHLRELSGEIELPGSLQQAGYGDDVSVNTPWVATLYDPLWYQRDGYLEYGEEGNVKIPFLLQPKKHYIGVAWYQCKIQVPEKCNLKRIVLSLERAHWETRVWLKEREIGHNNSLSVPHVYNLGILQAGIYTLTIRVDNRIKLGVGWNAHSITDHSQGNWNGIVGRIELSATTPVWIESVDIYPDTRQCSARVTVEIGNITGYSGSGTLHIGDYKTLEISWSELRTIIETEIVFPPNTELWDEFNPTLHKLIVSLVGEHANHHYSVTFGLRDIEVDGIDFLVNRRKVFFRGTHEGCTFPLTGYSPCDVDSWKRIINICKEHGLNHMRFHSWCPPEAAFIAADQLGFYLQPEGPLWAKHNGSISPDTLEEEFLYQETERILKAYGNHPSFVLFAYGNEPGGNWFECLTKWVKYYKQKDNRRLYAAESGWPFKHEFMDYKGTGVQYAVFGRIGYNFVRGYRSWKGKDFSHTVNNTNVPIISHELGQHCVFPNFHQIPKYTGVNLPNNLKIFREIMQKHGMLHQAEHFVMASGKLQVLAYKEDIEACLRTPGLGGFQLLDLHDYPGQGSAFVGVLDAFWDAKPYINATQFRRFCNETVLLARMEKHIYYPDEPFNIRVDIAHMGARAIENALVYWRVENSEGEQLTSGEFPVSHIELGTGIYLGNIEINLRQFEAPAEYRLFIGLTGTEFENDWKFWVYPKTAKMSETDDILITKMFDQKAITKLSQGGKVMFLAASQLGWESPPFGFYPIFWNRLMSPKWERTLGLLCDPNHPALAHFPTRYHSDWQWENVLIPACRGVNMESLPQELQPVVQCIDDWNRSLRLGLIFECLVGKGKLLVCSANLEHELNQRPAAKQLYYSLLSYMSSAEFSPKVKVEVSQIEALLFDSGLMQKLGAKITADSEMERTKAALIIDGNPNTFWQTPSYRQDVTDYPHWIEIEFPQSTAMDGIICMNRQNSMIHEGDIKEYVLEASDDRRIWVQVNKGRLVSSVMPQKILFDHTVTAKYLRLTAISGYDRQPAASLAELAVIYAGPKLYDKDIEVDEDEDYIEKSQTAEVDEPI